MDSQNQFTVFCLCIIVGFVGSVTYEIFFAFRCLCGCRREKYKLLGAIFDILFFLTFAFLCIAAAYFLRFPSFRVYMWLGFGLGGGLYSKTLRRMVAFLEKVCYNMLRKVATKLKKRKNSLNGGKDL